MNKDKINVLTMACGLMLLASCGTSKLAQNNGSTPQKQNTENKATANAPVSEAIQKLTFVQKVSDNQVYTKNIVGSASFNIQAGGKNISVDGTFRMRKDEVIRIQLAPIFGIEVGRLEFTPDYVLIIDRIHKEYIKADYNQVDFLKRQGINFYSLQALFWNQLLVPGNQKVSESDLKKFDANLASSGDVVPVSLKNGDMTYTWNANRTNGRIGEAVVTYRTAKLGTSQLTFKYGDFKSVGVKLFPAKQNLTFSTQLNGKHQEAKLNIEMNEVKTDANWDARSEVSSKYKQVSPEDVLSKIMNM